MRFRLWVLCLTATWLALGSGAPSVVHACSPPGPCLGFYGGVQPRDGAGDVVRNVELRIHYVASQELTRLDVFPTVENEAGHAVDVVWSRSLAVLRGRLRSPLAARTSYRIRHSFETCPAGSTPGFCAGSGLCPAAVPSTIATFTTGDARDDTRPAPVTFGPLATTQTRRVTDSAACGPYDGCSHTWKVSPLEAGHMLRLVRHDGVVTDTTPDGELRAEVYSGRIPYGGGAVLQHLGAAHYDAFVVDQAGNLSDPMPLDVPDCSPFEAGQSDSDGGVGADDGGTPPTERANESGCSARPSNAATAGPAWLLAMLLGLSLRRRGRAPSPNGARL